MNDEKKGFKKTYILLIALAIIACAAAFFAAHKIEAVRSVFIVLAIVAIAALLVITIICLFSNNEGLKKKLGRFIPACIILFAVFSMISF